MESLKQNQGEPNVNIDRYAVVRQKIGIEEGKFDTTNITEADFQKLEQFPTLRGSEAELIEICKKLGAQVITGFGGGAHGGLSDFEHRRLYYVVVGDNLDETNAQKSKILIEEATKICEQNKVEKVLNEFSSNSFDDGLSGYIITGGDRENISHYEVSQLLPQFLHVSDIRWANTADHRRGKTHQEQSFFIDTSKILSPDLTIKIKERDKYIFIGKKGSTIDNLKSKLGVQKINIRNPDYSQEVCDDFVSYATNERNLSRLPERFSVWKKIFERNSEIFDEYNRLLVRSNGLLPILEDNYMNKHYSSIFQNYKIVGMDQLCNAVRSGQAEGLDLSKKLLVDKEEIETKNPLEVEQDNVRFKIDYASNKSFTKNTYYSNMGRYIASTKISDESLENGVLENGLLLPNGRNVLLIYSLQIPSAHRSQEINAFTSLELKVKIQDLLRGELIEELYQQTHREFDRVIPEPIRSLNGWLNSELKRRLQSMPEQFAGTHQIDGKNFSTKLREIKKQITDKIVEIGLQVNEILELYKEQKMSVDNFFAKLPAPEAHFFTSKKEYFNQLFDKIFEVLLSCNFAEAQQVSSNLEAEFLDLISHKDQLYQNYIKEREKAFENVPSFISEYFKEDVDIFDAIAELEFVEQKIAKMPERDLEYYSFELSVGKDRRYSAMLKLLQGFPKLRDEGYYSKLPSFVGSNRNEYFEVRNYLFNNFSQISSEEEYNLTVEEVDVENEISINWGQEVSLDELRSKYSRANGMEAKLLKGQLLEALNKARNEETDQEKKKRLKIEIENVKKDLI